MKEYGSHNIGEIPDELLQKSKKLIPALFSINNKGGIIGEKKYQKILDLFEIIKFSKENYPYLLTLKFNDDKLLKKVNIWKDPHYSMINNERSDLFIENIHSQI